jgi:chemotaxis protein methyltransferase CheR
MAIPAGGATGMIASADSIDVERFRQIISGRFGLNFDDSKLPFLADVLKHRQETVRQDAAAYLGRLESAGHWLDELRELAIHLTVNETYFFRNQDQFRALMYNALPARVAARKESRSLRVLSAGCASGEEAYSLAIILRENVPDPSWNVSVRAIDVNAAVLEKAKRARYSPWSLRETSPETQRRWFATEGKDFVLDKSVRDAVVFEERNLAEENADLWKAESYDVVFCRNVIMYLTPENARAVIARIARSLAPGGYLFLGHAETLRGLSQDFHLEHTHDTFYYRSKGPSERGMPLREGMSQPFSAVSEILPTLVLVDDGATWVEAIQRASERIANLSHASQLVDERQVEAAPAATSHRTQLLDLLEKERYDDALAIARKAPAESVDDPEALLLRAALLVHAGQIEQAETACKDLLRIDELNAGAHYLRALCLESKGDSAAAAEQDRVAVYLDPAFAMPRLHLGLLARRTGDRAAARVEFARALTLLQVEDASRLVLFGGGFGRDALLALCRAELVACGGKP